MNELLSLEMGHRRARILVVCVVVGCVILCAISVIMSFYYSNDFSQRIYVVNRGAAMEIMSTNVMDNRKAEANFHVTRFHDLFFTLAPDARSIEANFNKASFLCDESAKVTFDKLKEDQFYQRVIQTNTTQKIEVVKVDLNLTTYPYHAVTTFKVIQERATSRSTRLLMSESDLVDVNRSEANPNGFLMRNFKITQSSKAKEEKISS